MEPDRKRDRVESVPRLYDDLIFKILSRLPVKDLLRCKSICKQWRIMIASPSFQRQHLQVSVQSEKLISVTREQNLTFNSCLIKSIYEYPKSVESMRLGHPFKDPSCSYWIVGSCNGLVCLRAKFDEIYLENPCIRETRKLPSMDLMNGVYKGAGCYAVYGFGYDKRSEDYKVVVILSAPRMWSYETEVMVWSMKSDKWRNVGQFPVCGPQEVPGRFLNGALHWAVPCSSIGAGFEKLLCIAAFDLETERFREVPLPDDKSFINWRLGVVGGSLCISALNEGAYPNLSLSVMKEYGVERSWTTLFRMHLDQWPNVITPLSSSGEGEILLLLDQHMVILDPKKLKVRHPEVNNFVPLAGTNTFVESLISPLQMRAEDG